MTHSTDSRRVMLVSFDGLRADLIRPDTTPNLVKLQRQGVTLARHRTVYPSETRAAMPSLVTGTWPGLHGMVGNAYLDRSTLPSLYADTSDDRLIEQLDQASGGTLFGATSLGEVLAANGRTLAVLASNSAGTTRLFNHKARALGHLTVSGHYPSVWSPETLQEDFERRFGRMPPVPPQGTPDLQAQTFLTSALLEAVWKETAPDVAILSFGEPDISSHYCGTAEERTLQALAWTDREFGRVLDWFESEGRAQGVHLVAVSDHGHVSVHQRADVHEVLKSAGFRSAWAPARDVDALVVPGQVGAIYLANPSEENIRRVVAAMTESPWCGSIFTTGRSEVEGIAPGSFARSLVNMEHARVADILFSYRADDEIDPFGLIGRTWSSDGPIGLGVHGGLHPKEMQAVCILAGEAFKSDAVSDTPSGICDVAPTILELIGLVRPEEMQGRVLDEAFSSSQTAELIAFKETIREAGTRGYRQFLRHLHVRGTTYVDSGWVEAKGMI
ncbi:alkaline phosphatase family protein [Phyllobacterium chamaecytisi]|uniref:alkaline phosphatase family protein n=1 Tax=Phyllobacterium chamaecytisi TaxID=2876082 RepID=UPI001CCF6594|nr:nucleotide pyrophosphatase/phosphodiesterase family protein [Phyllobacterium sp. KW56]MBZ9603009.1 alkaline phosphatase family protein [Phyllobacterium sp. KW56]